VLVTLPLNANAHSNNRHIRFHRGCDPVLNGMARDLRYRYAPSDDAPKNEHTKRREQAQHSFQQ